jgi:hypothetical protein
MRIHADTHRLKGFFQLSILLMGGGVGEYHSHVRPLQKVKTFS